jgi:uncharacterized protein (TIGR03435 family)
MEVPRRSIPFALIVLSFAHVAMHAQTATVVGPRFEVASIKPGPPGARGQTLYNPTRERFAADSITTKALIAYAYDVREFQISSGPSWLGSEEYNIVAKPEGDVAGERALAMVRNLLAERFNLMLHRESREMPVLTLMATKNGLKLQPSQGTAGPEVRGGRGRLIARNVTMEMLAAQLASRVLIRPVVDRTGITGKFDIDLTWTPDESADPGLSIFAALEEQLGLKLETRKGPVDVLVIDRVDRPSAN